MQRRCKKVLPGQNTAPEHNILIRNNAGCFCFVMYARTYVVVTQIVFGDFSRRINYENYYIYSFLVLVPIKVNKPYSSQMLANSQQPQAIVYSMRVCVAYPTHSNFSNMTNWAKSTTWLHKARDPAGTYSLLQQVPSAFGNVRNNERFHFVCRTHVLYGIFRIFGDWFLELYCILYLESDLYVMVPIIVDYILGVGKTHSPRIATPHKYFDLEE